MDTNPYQPPRDETDFLRPPAADSGRTQVDLVHLEMRVRELERRIEGTRLLSPNFFTRMLAVFGHWFLGYLMLVLAFIPVMLALSLVLAALGEIEAPH